MTVANWHISPDKTRALDQPRVMAILNLTPDSFSDGGSYPTVEAAVRAAGQAVAEGADILDLGGESTRPGAARVPVEEQIRRVAPVLRAIRAVGGELGRVPITIDTTLAPVAAAALHAGADAINDVSAGLEDPAILDLAARQKCGVILMHRLQAPDRDSYSDRYTQPPEYEDVVATVAAFLKERAEAAISRGIPRQGIVVDPGVGFGKTVAQNLELIRRGGEIAALGYPVLSAVSRKSFVGRAMGLESSAPLERLPGSIALSLAHHRAGATIFRTHDVAALVRALRASRAVDEEVT
jgi:dihydropteroate synthase